MTKAELAQAVELRAALLAEAEARLKSETARLRAEVAVRKRELQAARDGEPNMTLN